MTPLERATKKACNFLRNIGVDKPEDVAEFMAVAVIGAIREEASPEIRKAMRETVPVYGYEWDHQEREVLIDGTVLDPELDHWRAMIDALLTEGDVPDALLEEGDEATEQLLRKSQ